MGDSHHFYCTTDWMVQWMLVGTGMQIPAAAASVLNQSHQPPPTTPTTQAAAAATPQSMPPIATQCFMLSNMFDAKTRCVALFIVIFILFSHDCVLVLSIRILTPSA